jgi:hypothetical protein
MEEAGGVAARLLALLEQEAQTLVLEGCASVHVTTIAEQYKVDHEDADETVYALRPTRHGALPLCLLPAGAGWYLLPGDGPSLEFWAGTDTDLEETRAVLRAVLAGQYRYAYDQRFERPLIARWRPPRGTWVCRGWIGDEVVTEHWNAPPDPGEPLEVQALPY